MEGHLCIKGKGIHDIIPTSSINTFAPKIISKVLKDYDQVGTKDTGLNQPFLKMCPKSSILIT